MSFLFDNKTFISVKIIEDSIYIPNILEQIGIKSENIIDEIKSKNLFIPRNAKEIKGFPLHSTFF
jgi:hypothetical protein